MADGTNRVNSWSLGGGARGWMARSVVVGATGLPGVSDTSGE